MAFAAGWTPCIGPVLAGILAIAAGGGSLKGAALLAADRLVGRLGWVRRHYRAIAGVSGALLATVGILLMTGLFRQVFAPLARFAPGL